MAGTKGELVLFANNEFAIFLRRGVNLPELIVSFAGGGRLDPSTRPLPKGHQAMPRVSSEQVLQDWLEDLPESREYDFYNERGGGWRYPFPGNADRTLPGGAGFPIMVGEKSLTYVEIERPREVYWESPSLTDEVRRKIKNELGALRLWFFLDEFTAAAEKASDEWNTQRYAEKAGRNH